MLKKLTTSLYFIQVVGKRFIMIKFYIIIIYILNVFLNRYLNKVAIKYGAEKVWILWFLPIITTIVLLFGILLEIGNNSKNWFIGKDW